VWGARLSTPGTRRRASPRHRDHGRRACLRLLRIRGPLRLRLRREARLEVRPWRRGDDGRRRRDLACSLPRAADPPLRRGQRREVLHRGPRPPDGEGGLARPPEGRVELGDSVLVSRAPRRARDCRQPAHPGLRPRHRPRAVALKGLESNAVTTPVVGDGVVVVLLRLPLEGVGRGEARGRGDITGSPQVLWRYEKGSAYVPSPILYDGPRLPHDRQGPADLSRRPHRRGPLRRRAAAGAASFTASPVAVNGAPPPDEPGRRHLRREGRSPLRGRGTNPLGEPVSASAAVAGGRLYIRGEKHLFAIGARPAPEPGIKNRSHRSARSHRLPAGCLVHPTPGSGRAAQVRHRRTRRASSPRSTWRVSSPRSPRRAASPPDGGGCERTSR